MFDKLMKLQGMLVDYATGGNAFDETLYLKLRKELMDDPSLKKLVPDFIRKNRNGGALWGYFKSVSNHWQPRREHIWSAFAPLLDHVENSNRSPADVLISDALESFDPEGIHKAWAKALERRHNDRANA